MAQKKGTSSKTTTKSTTKPVAKANTAKTVAAKPKTSPAKKSTKSKGTVIGIVGGILVIVAAVAVGAVVLTSKPDYHKSFDEVKELYAKLQNFTDGSDCEKLSNDGGEVDVSEETLKGYITGCKNEVKEISELNRKLGATSGIKKDDELKQRFEDYNAKWQTLVSHEDGLEADLQAYLAMHRFVVKADELDLSEDPEGMYELGDILIDSDNAGLKEYGETWNKHARTVIDVMTKYQKATTVSERIKLQDELMTALEDLEDFLSDTTLLESAVNLNQTNAESMTDAFEDLYDAIEDKAE